MPGPVGNRSWRRTNTGAHLKKPSKLDVQRIAGLKQEDLPDTDPGYINFLWTLVADSKPLPANMTTTNVGVLPDEDHLLLPVGDPLNPLFFKSSIVPDIFTRLRITFNANKADPGEWTRIKQTMTRAGSHQSKEKDKQVTQSQEDDEPTTLPSSRPSPTSDQYGSMEEEVKNKLEGPACELWEALRKHVLILPKVVDGKDTVLVQEAVSKFRLKNHAVYAQTFQLPPLTRLLNQSSAPDNSDIRPARDNHTLTNNNTVRNNHPARDNHTAKNNRPARDNHTVTDNHTVRRNRTARNNHATTENRLVLYNPYLITSLGDDSTHAKQAKDSQLVTIVLGLQLPSSVLDFEYALDAQKISESEKSGPLSEYTFVTLHEHATCPFFSVIFDDFPEDAPADIAERISLLEAKFAVFAASALWNRLRLHEKAKVEMGVRHSDAVKEKFLHFGLSILGARYTLYLAEMAEDERLEEDGAWSGCKISILLSASMHTPSGWYRLRELVDIISGWGSSMWKDGVLEDLKLLLQV